MATELVARFNLPANDLGLLGREEAGLGLAKEGPRQAEVGAMAGLGIGGTVAAGLTALDQTC